MTERRRVAGYHSFGERGRTSSPCRDDDRGTLPGVRRDDDAVLREGLEVDADREGGDVGDGRLVRSFFSPDTRDLIDLLESARLSST